ncbi:MAG: host attachment protein [Verrucomicrobiota bacterium]
MKSEFLIVADRGNVKAYRIENLIAKGLPRVRVQLVQAFALVDAHYRIGETVSDQAGAFPMSEGIGSHARHPSSAGERHLELERDRRLIKEIATHVTEILKREKPGYWAFAAPSEIHHAVLNELAPPVRELIDESIYADLVNIPASELLSHIPKNRAA